MSIQLNPTTGLPQGRWLTDPREHHWLVYRKLYFDHDATGNDIIGIRQESRMLISEARSILDEHSVNVINVIAEESNEYSSHYKIIKIAIAFASIEDKVMAKLLLKCDE